VWANASAVKIEWDDGEKVTWKRAELASKGLEVLSQDQAPEPEAPEAMTEEATPPETPAPEVTPAAKADAEPAAAATGETPNTDAAEATAATGATLEATPDAVPVDPAAPESTAEAKPAKKSRTRKPKAESDAPKKSSALDAAAKVLAAEKRPMNTKELIGAMAARGYWSSPGGKTPHATLYSAILQEMETKGSAARFVKVGKGQFAFRQQA
jgi:hypothetical protein